MSSSNERSRFRTRAGRVLKLPVNGRGRVPCAGVHRLDDEDSSRISTWHREAASGREFFRKLHWEELQQLKTQIEAEEARIRRLESGSDNWHHARRIREYVLALVECKKKQEKELGPHTALGKWTIWALQQADRIDPLTESPKSVLDRKRELEGWSPYGWR